MEDTSEPGPNVVNASFMEPFLLLIRDDLSICVLGPDDSGDLDLLEQGERLHHEKWLSGSLYDDTNDIFRLQYDDVEDEEAGHCLMFLLSTAGGLHVSTSLILAVGQSGCLSNDVVGISPPKPFKACLRC